MQSIVILSGAGLSAESGLGTFRDKGGVWTKFDLAEVATPEGYARDPAKVQDFYNARRKNLLEAVPNAAHEALARLWQAAPEKVTIITQNIDDLHERAGAGEVIHIHGELLQSLCAYCGARAACRDDLSTSDICTFCSERGGVRPDVVWFGEIPYHMEECLAALAACDLFVSIGTSGSVYPAAGFVAEAAAHGADTLELNLEPSEGSSQFAETRFGPATKVVPEWVEEIFGGELR